MPVINDAEALCANADTLLADYIARESAIRLMTEGGRMREGHILALEGHARALAEGLGDDGCSDILDELADHFRYRSREVRDAADMAAGWKARQHALHEQLRKHGWRPNAARLLDLKEA